MSLDASGNLMTFRWWLTQERKERQIWWSRGAVGEGLGSISSRDAPVPLASAPGWRP